MVEFEYIRDASRADAVARALRNEKSLGYDHETTGLDPHVDKVSLTSISTPSGKTYVFDCRDVRVLDTLKPVLEDESLPKLGVNLLFDHVMALGTRGITSEGLWDLMLAEQCLTAGLQKSGFGFDDISKKYLGKEVDKTLQTSFVGHKGEFSQAQLEYAATDTALLHPLADEMKKAILKEGVAGAWKTETRAIPAFAEIQFYGNKLDVPGWQKIITDSQKIFEDQQLALDRWFEPYFNRDLFGHLDINYKSPDQILYGLQMMGIQVDGETIKDTNKNTFKKIPHLPVVIEMNKYRSAKTILERYGQNFLDAIHPVTGRIHPKMFQYGTATGRPAATARLNTLNVPRDKRFRTAFITDDGRMISTVDYSGAELRIMADLSGDPLMVHGFNSGVDFHCYVAAMLFNREKVEKSDPIRQPTKTLNFG